MNKISKRKLVFVKVCSPFSFNRFKNAEKIYKKKRSQESILSPRFTSPRFTSPRFTSPHFTGPRFTSPRFTSPVQSSPVGEIQYAVSIVRAVSVVIECLNELVLLKKLAEFSLPKSV